MRRYPITARIPTRVRVLATMLFALLVPLALSAPSVRAQSTTKSAASAKPATSTSGSAAPSSSTSSIAISPTASIAVDDQPSANKVAGGAVGPEVPEIPQVLPNGASYEGKLIVAVRYKIQGVIWTKPPQLPYPKVGEKLSLAKATEQLRLLLAGGGFAKGDIAVADQEGASRSSSSSSLRASFVEWCSSETCSATTSCCGSPVCPTSPT